MPALTTMPSRCVLAVGLCLAIQAAAAGPPDPAVTRLGQAVTAYEKHDFFTAVHLLTASGQPAKLRDYVAWYLANAELVTNSGDSAVRDLAHYIANPLPGSPLAGRLDLLYAKALLGQNPSTPASALKAREILQADSALLPQPDGDYALAQAFQATGFPRQAAVYFQRVYYTYPTADLSEKAKAAADKLRPTLGGEFPEASARQQLDRGNAWLTAKQYVKAREEFALLAENLKGAERDEAQAGIGAALFLGGDPAGSMNYLTDLQPEDADAAAERLYYLTESYRKLDNGSAMLDAVHQLDERYPVSPWRLKALIAAGDFYLWVQDRAHYVPLFQAAVEGFPGDSSAALSEWHVAWAAWLERSPRRVQLLKEQIAKFPADTHVSDALFFLGRAAEEDSDFAAARAYYERLSARFAHYYYAGLARTQLTEPKLAAVKADPAVRTWLEHTDDAAAANAVPADTSGAPNEATRARIERGRLLIAAGLTTQAVEEIAFGAKQENEQPVLLAMDLSRAMPTPYLAVRVMKKFSGDYLSVPFEKASRAFWEMLFPIPYEETLDASATESDLDPFAVAGLIRQESEFNPAARSAFAYGLMQLRPSTGKELGRTDGIKVANTGMLLNPTLNIKLGTQYLRGQLSHWDGDWVKTLAAYNAGPTRVRQWLDQFGYGDAAEFIENIPFDETRNYVQAVLRNGQIYRELYGKQKAALAPEVADDSAVPPAKITDIKTVSKVVSKRPLRAARRTTASAKTTKAPVAVTKAVTKATAKPAAVASAHKPAAKGAATKKATGAASTQKHAAA